MRVAAAVLVLLGVLLTIVVDVAVASVVPTAAVALVPELLAGTVEGLTLVDVVVIVGRGVPIAVFVEVAVMATVGLGD